MLLARFRTISELKIFAEKLKQTKTNIKEQETTNQKLPPNLTVFSYVALSVQQCNTHALVDL